MAASQLELPEGAMFSFSHPGQASAAVQSMLPADPGWASAADDVALGCESADPALQIAMWGQEAERVQVEASAS